MTDSNQPDPRDGSSSPQKQQNGAAPDSGPEGAVSADAAAVAAAATASAASPASGSAAEGQAASEGPVDVARLQRELAFLRGALEESQTRARETSARLTEEHDRLMRAAADFENYKKRAVKETADARKFGVESLLKEFLPVADNLDRALDHAESHDPKQVIEGVRLVQKLFEATLARFGVTSFSALGKPFDPTLHEALMQQESDEPANTVVQEMARGYKLHERLVRPAAVVVSKARTTTGA